MARDYVIACDLGTGGCKSSLYDDGGDCLNGIFEEYSTYYPQDRMHEQKPLEWLEAVKTSIKSLAADLSPEVRTHIRGIGLSGHSLGMVPLSKDGELLLDSVPIWSDSRSDKEELEPFFNRVSEESWYMKTGNGFPPGLYTAFKILWMKHHQPEIFEKTDKVIGTKDYINYMMTGVIATDYSYASGTGVYDLKAWDYSDELLEAAELDRALFPEIVESTKIIGTMHESMAAELGLPKNVQIAAGGVDNSCMALGAGCFQDGRLYNSLGSSSWVAVSSEEPVLDIKTRPYVFTHVVPGLFTSAESIFSAGSSYKWFAKLLYGEDGEPDYNELNKSAETISPGCENLLFNPSLAGGNALDKSAYIRGGFIGLSLPHTRAHMTRAVLEGVGFGLRIALDALRDVVKVSDSMTIVGGGSKSSLWREILSDIFNIKVVKSNIDQQAAALGAAALTLYGCGIWKDFSRIDELHVVESVSEPDKERAAVYDKLLEDYKMVSDFLSQYGEKIQDKK